MNKSKIWAELYLLLQIKIRYLAELLRMIAATDNAVFLLLFSLQDCSDFTENMVLNRTTALARIPAVTPQRDGHAAARGV